MRLTLSIALGVAIIAIGFRWTDEVTVIVALMVLTGGALGFLWPYRAWLWGLGIGLGTRILPEPPLSVAHIAREGASKPLPLPFGLTTNPAAEWIAGSLLIMAFPLAGACAGWALRRIADYTTTGTSSESTMR